MRFLDVTGSKRVRRSVKGASKTDQSLYRIVIDLFYLLLRQAGLGSFKGGWLTGALHLCGVALLTQQDPIVNPWL